MSTCVDSLSLSVLYLCKLHDQDLLLVDRRGCLDSVNKSGDDDVDVVGRLVVR